MPKNSDYIFFQSSDISISNKGNLQDHFLIPQKLVVKNIQLSNTGVSQLTDLTFEVSKDQAFTGKQLRVKLPFYTSYLYDTSAQVFSKK